MLVPPLRDFFSLSLLSLRDGAIVLSGVAAWALLVWIFWRYRFVDRFLGTDIEEPTATRGPRGPDGTVGP